jgi:hypothetical protein
MKKKLAFVCAALLSTSSFASLSSTTYVDALTKGVGGQRTELFTKHDWSVSNDSPLTQTVSICYTTTVCAEAPSNMRTIRTCEQVTLDSMVTKAGSKMQDLVSVYYFYGYCNVTSTTEINGWQSQASSVKGKLRIVH